MEEMKVFICACGNLEHQVIFWHDKEWSDELYTEIRLLNHRNFIKRLWVGLKYAFGYKSRYGNFDSFILSKNDEKKLLDILKERQL